MKKTVIVHGSLDTTLKKRAVKELTEILLDYTFDYAICIPYDKDSEREDCRRIYVGTKENNPYIRANSENKLSVPESYTIKIKNDTVVIEGYDDAGALYGVLDFYNKYIVKFEHPDTDEYYTNVFEKELLPDFEYSSAPTVAERGLWSWGHVIYDYRGYFDNMLKLKMNSVIIWNDFAPLNAKEIVEYAHSCNIKLYWGFSWLWDTDCLRLDIKELEGEAERIFDKYEKEYSTSGADGIYFQTFTETKQDNIKGVIIADAATKFVNQTSALFYSKYRNIKLMFGLHAMSVKDRLEFIKKVDSRISIIWEDCGAFPFSYVPTDISDFDNTKEFIARVAHLRSNNDRFGAVTKGLVKLDWTQFEHLQGSQYIGVSSKTLKQDRIARKQRIWKYIQAAWLAHADKAQEMVQHLYHLKGGALPIFALVEDGMFEENIMYPVALYSEILWNCNEELKNLVKYTAMRSYVSFA